MQVLGPHFFNLCDEVVLIVWSLQERIDGECRVEGAFGEAIAPLSCLKLATADGGTRIIWAMRRPKDSAQTFLVTAGGAGAAPISFDPSAPTPGADVFSGLTQQSRLSLISALVSSWVSLFRLQQSPSLMRVLRDTLAPAKDKTGVIAAMVEIDRAIIFETQLPPGFGAIKSAYALSLGRLARLKIKAMPAKPSDTMRNIRRFLCERPDFREPVLVVLRGEFGFVARQWNAAKKVAGFEAWWENNNRRDEGLRQACIKVLSEHSAAARASVIEFQLRSPLKAKVVMGSAVLPRAQIELALACGSGTLVGGWYRDPSGFVGGLDVLDDADVPQSMDVGRYDFPGKIGVSADDALPATGFIHLTPHVRGALLQPRFLLRLKSGVRHLLTPPVQPVDWSDARAAALRSVPPQALNDELIGRCLAPVLEEMQAAASQSVGGAIVKQVGSPVERPVVSIIVPLYKVLDFLLSQIAAFATDPQIARRCEIIYVLDSPEQADTVEHLLTGQHLVYGLPFTLAVMPQNGGYAMANNRGAALARGDCLALLNSDVIPIEPGWLGELIGRLDNEAVGIVGPKLLFEDDSLQHAGLFFSRDHRGRWLNHHYYKGMPRHYAPARVERSVPGVTGACMVIKRTLFEQVGGFTEDYVIGDYEDSDLCLKARALGQDIVYVPSAELYHLERRSMRENTDYMRGVASQYNSWLQEQRWGDVIGHLMQDRFATQQSLQRAA